MVPQRRFTQKPVPSRPKFEYDEFTNPLNLAKETNIDVPRLEAMDEGPCVLFVLDEDVSIEMVNKALEEIFEDDYSKGGIWLAEDTFDCLKDSECSTTAPPIRSDWRSPFLGHSVEDAFRFVASTIPEEKDIQHSIIAVLNKHFFEKDGWVLLYNVDVEGIMTPIPCSVERLVQYTSTVHDHRWKLDLEDWRKRGKPAM